MISYRGVVFVQGVFFGMYPSNPHESTIYIYTIYHYTKEESGGVLHSGLENITLVID